MKNFGKKSTFAGFLPGIAGVRGIPVWCYYVNRGQGVCSFGTSNKDGSIMEFSPAHVAYQSVKRTGFRTFIRKDGRLFEAFSDEKEETELKVEKNLLSLEENNGEGGFTVNVNYYVLPEESIGALIREVYITNTSNSTADFEILDGMPALIPYGISQDNMKNMTQTAKAWMQSEFTEGGNAFYRVRASLEDSTKVDEILSGNFALGYGETGEKMTIVTDPEAVFSYDTSLGVPVRFKEEGLAGVTGYAENRSNLVPCAFFARTATLNPGETVSLYEEYGFADRAETLDEYANCLHNKDYFAIKKSEVRKITDELVKVMSTKTGNKAFNDYSEYNYMDNCLRGGYPIRLGNNKIFYVYSRKHGDTERDYNYFSLLPEFYSQGNGSYRDINQNRRCDSFFAPFTGTENIREFYNLIQLDGYNPLGIEKLTYILNPEKAESLLAAVPKEHREVLKALVTKEYTPGSLYMALLKVCAPQDAEDVFTGIIDFSESLINGNFGEGYWCDHWTYNLDLVEDYLSVFPDKEKELLFDTEFTYFKSEAKVLPRSARYVKTERGIRQYDCVVKDKNVSKDKTIRGDFGRGNVHKVSLAEKLILLSLIKFTTLDPHGMGIEMEGGKPGWYDALNGLPALFGSSVGESCELARNLLFTVNALKKYPGNISLTKEVYDLLTKVSGALGEDDALTRWNLMNDIKEKYRETVYAGISGASEEASSETVSDALSKMYKTVMEGIEKALRYGDGICPMYFMYEVTDFKEENGKILPLEFTPGKLPAFLEGTVHYLKLPESVERKRSVCNGVRESGLYDKKLSMYKVNASLKEASFELGRCTAFTPGWLENESVWLHMEYKYLLELLKSGLYTEFIRDFKNAAIPFLDEETYGRSPMENSSFIASSANPDPRIHGKGFVARLSGSTVEFMSMWKLMFFGAKPFEYRDNLLSLSFAPTVPGYLIGEDRRVTVMFLGSVPVTYRFDRVTDYIPGNYRVESITLNYKNGTVVNLSGNKVIGLAAEDVRSSRVSAIEVTVIKKEH